jgi:hypothetical protein
MLRDIENVAYRRLRSTDRRGARLEAVLEDVAETDVKVLVRNLSCGGMLATSPFPLQVGQRVLVRLAALDHRPATIRWQQAGFYGFQFQRGLTQRQLLQVFSGGVTHEKESAAMSFMSNLKAVLRWQGGS